jgi:hypothetical protein
MAGMDLEEYRREYVDFNAALMREIYLFQSGQKLSLELAPIYDRYGDLFSLDSILGLKRRLDEIPSHFETERKSIRRLLCFAVECWLDCHVRELTEEIGRREAESPIEWKGRIITFQDSVIAIAEESDRELRRALYDKRAAIIEGSNDLRAERLAKLHEAARKLAITEDLDYKKLYGWLLGLDWEAIGREAWKFLDGTQSVYQANLDRSLGRNLGIKVEQAERHDAIYLNRLPHYDEFFPAEALKPVYKETMSGLGIEIEAQNNIEIDDEPRPHKNPRAFCIPILIPEEIKLVIRPVGGHSDYFTFFHEVGHAQHYGWTSANLRPEFKYTDDYALTETYAFLFNHLPMEAEWLADLVRFRASRDFINWALFWELMMVRRYAAKFLYECQLHSGLDLGQAASLYAELQVVATGFKAKEAEFLFDLDDAFYSAGYLRGWAFEVMLRDHLKTRFGRKWWQSRRAGNFLKEIWETGELYSADEMASQIGIGPISFDPLIEEFTGQLSKAA